jgi:hypothetical protein
MKEEEMEGNKTRRRTERANAVRLLVELAKLKIQCRQDPRLLWAVNEYRKKKNMSEE